MRRLDGMLMIGSTGANVGKTELACAILRKYSKQDKIIGIKVTTIEHKDGQCPRGGDGCGVCSSLDGVFCITQESNRDAGKDTSRLLNAGAARVFWLRVLREHLPEGFAALLDVLGPDAVSICESNSLRHVVEPGLFLMVTDPKAGNWKDSAREVKQYASRIIVSDGNGFDLNLDEIELIDGKWRLREQTESDGANAPIQATAIILAGGGSGRMGADKSLLPVEGRPLIQRICRQLRARFGRILISANDPEKLRFLGLEVVPDRISWQGPLMGIASALELSSSELNFVVACDIPYIDMGFVEEMLAQADMSGADVVIPITSKGKYEPLFAVYRRSVLEPANKILASGGRRISDIFTLCNVKCVNLGDADWLINLNTPAEYEKFRRQHEGQHLHQGRAHK